MQISFDAPARLLAALAMVGALGACAAPGPGSDTAANSPPQQADRMPESAASTATAPSAGATMGGGTMGSMQSGGPMMSGQVDKNATCRMYRNMQNATEEQRQAMMDQQMQGMSPEMRQRHMQMMQQHCQQPAAR